LQLKLYNRIYLRCLLHVTKCNIAHQRCVFYHLHLDVFCLRSQTRLRQNVVKSCREWWWNARFFSIQYIAYAFH